MLVPAAKAQALVIGGSHRRWRDAVCYCVATHVLPPTSSERILGCGRRDTAGGKVRFGRHHMFASICNHYNRKSIE
jgi:hypothetical protein